MLFVLCFFLLGDQPLYHPELDGLQQIQQAVAQANAQGKHVLIQVGGEWCSWCKAMDRLLESDETLKAEMAKDFVLVHLNYSKENKNPQAMAQLGYPQRFGFPVWVILDGKGKRLHTQESGALETPGEKAHDPEKVMAVLKGWSPQALDPSQYAE